MTEKDQELNIADEMEEVVSDEPVKASQKSKEKRWYIVHTYSGYENKVKSNLEKRIEYMNMSDRIFRVEARVIPMWEC